MIAALLHPKLCKTFQESRTLNYEELDMQNVSLWSQVSQSIWLQAHKALWSKLQTNTVKQIKIFPL